MSSFTCISCRVAFTDADIQRAHYKSDWHRYNLKRKVADLPPVTATVFAEKVTKNREMAAAAEKDQSKSCSLCNKHFSSQNAYNSHIRSKKHKEAEAIVGDAALQEAEVNARQSEAKTVGPTADIQEKTVTERSSTFKQTEMEVEEVSSDEWDDMEGEGLPVECCLFCGRESSSLEENMQHMSTEHSFFIPDLEYLTDLEGLLLYLGEKVALGHFCLWCSDKGKTFHDLASVQKHMQDKGHCKMLFEGSTLHEYADFYDYSSSYPEIEGQTNPDEEIDVQQLDADNYELKLPSGATIGHRSLLRYYRQNLPNRNHTSYEKARAIKDKILGHYKALGWTGTTGSQTVQRANDIKFMQKVKQKHRLRMGMHSNNLRPHNRSQIFFQMKH